MISKDRLSFSSANIEIPLKVVRDLDLVNSCIKDGKIIPIHLQLNPTNRCNFNCSFCSCSARNRDLELPYSLIHDFIDVFVTWGKSVTITGGGEPSLHEDYDLILECLIDNELDIGLVTNGTTLNNIKRLIPYHTWIRVSASKELHNQVNFMRWIDIIKTVSDSNKKVDWAFSYVVNDFHILEDLKFLKHLINVANVYGFTHVRLVNDIFYADDLNNELLKIEAWLKMQGVNVNKVNFQSRSTWKRGSNPCYISLLKPVLAPDGYIYPCCGIQYALDDPSRNFEKTMRMGYFTEFEEMIKKQRFFDGSVCSKCYYYGYNNLLGVLLNGLTHETFL